jgi:hypothetical protein
MCNLRESPEYEATKIGRIVKEKDNRKRSANTLEAKAPAENLLRGSPLVPSLAPELARGQARAVKVLHVLLWVGYKRLRREGGVRGRVCRRNSQLRDSGWRSIYSTSNPLFVVDQSRGIYSACIISSTNKFHDRNPLFISARPCSGS